MVPADLHELLQGFVSESLDNLDDNEIRIGRLSKDDNDEDLKSIFRVFHTLKGLTGFFKLNFIKKVTHEAETLLDIYRKNPRPIPSDTVDLLFVVFDFLRESIGACGVTFSDDDYKDQAESILEQVVNEIARVSPSDSDSKDEKKSEKIIVDTTEHIEAIESTVTNSETHLEYIPEEIQNNIEPIHSSDDVSDNDISFIATDLSTNNDLINIDELNIKQQIENSTEISTIENEFVVDYDVNQKPTEQTKSLRESVSELKLTIDYQELIQAFVSQVLEKIYDFEANTGMLMEGRQQRGNSRTVSVITFGQKSGRLAEYCLYKKYST